MTVPHAEAGAVLLRTGDVLVVGGEPASDGASGTGRFLSGPVLNEDRFKLSKAVVSLKDGRVLIAGGADRPEVYDPTSGTFSPVGGAVLDGFLFSTATLLDDGRVLLAGGYAKPGGTGVNHAWLYQP